MTSVAELGVGSLDGLALDLIGPSRVVPNTFDRGGDVCVLGPEEGFTVVEGFDSSHLICMLFHNVGELSQEFGTFVAWGMETPGGVEGLACRCDSDIDIDFDSDIDFFPTFSSSPPSRHSAILVASTPHRRPLTLPRRRDPVLACARARCARFYLPFFCVSFRYHSRARPRYFILLGVVSLTFERPTDCVVAP